MSVGNDQSSDSGDERLDEIVADYLRRPAEPGNILIETLLVAADHLLRDGNYTATGRILESVNSVLDSMAETNIPPDRE